MWFDQSGLRGGDAWDQKIRRQIKECALFVPVISANTNARPEGYFRLEWGYALALHRGRPDEARRWLTAALKSWDDWPPVTRDQDSLRAWAALMLVEAGRHEEALKAVEKLVARSADAPGVVGTRAIVLAAAGRHEEAAALVKRWEQWDTRYTRGQPQYWRARLAARSGDKSRAVELLRQAVAGGLWLGNYNAFVLESGRSEPEFAALRGVDAYEQLLKPKG